jgi:hypothetical protein
MFKKSGIIFSIIILAFSCSRYHVKNEIRNSSTLSKLKNAGIIVRLPHNSPIPVSKFNKSIIQWLEPYEKTSRLRIIEGTDKNINRAKSEADRFMQFSLENDFQYYQCIGIIKLYLNKNKEELDNYKNEQNLDSFIIYEVDPFISSEMQVWNFSSMVVIVDNDYQITYLDHQFDSFDTLEIDRGILRENLLDNVTNRLLELLLKLKYIKEI